VNTYLFHVNELLRLMDPTVRHRLFEKSVRVIAEASGNSEMTIVFGLTEVAEGAAGSKGMYWRGC